MVHASDTHFLRQLWLCGFVVKKVVESLASITSLTSITLRTSITLITSLTTINNLMVKKDEYDEQRSLKLTVTKCKKFDKNWICNPRRHKIGSIIKETIIQGGG